jgi:hypothetical protein
LKDIEKEHDDSELEASTVFSDSPEMDDVNDNNAGEVDKGDDNDEDEVVFDSSSEVLNELGLSEEEMAEIDALDSEPEYETSLLEELEPAWEQITEDTIEFMLSEHSEEADEAAQNAILHLAVEQVCEGLGEDATDEDIASALETYDFTQDEPFFDAVKFGYLMGIEAASRRIIPQFIENEIVAEHVVEAAEQYSDYATGTYAEMVEEADTIMEQFHSEAIEIVEGMVAENDALQHRVNLLESEAVIAEECKDLTIMQRSEIQGLLTESEIPANDTFNLSDFRTKVKRMKLKYKTTPKTGLLDSPAYHPKSLGSDKMVNATVSAMQKMTPRKR